MHGHVMPYCYGSVCQHSDEDDLMHCTCSPNDPIVAHADLVSRTDVLISLLRDKRRERRSDRVAVTRIAQIARAMQHSGDVRGLQRAMEAISVEASRLATIVPPDERIAKLTVLDFVKSAALPAAEEPR
jgi:hypothetical protein